MSGPTDKNAYKNADRNPDANKGDHPVGVGIIGLGFMGRTHLASYARTAGCTVRALYDPRQGNVPAGNLITTGDDAERLLATLPRASTLDELLARRDIHIVSVCTPTDSHVELVRAAIRAGKHVLVEKPTALDATDIDRLDEEARAAGVIVMPAHCMRFWPAWSWMAAAVRTQRFGRVLRATFRRLGAAPSWSQDFYLDFARSGGAIVDLHIHDADFVRFAFGEPLDVTATGNLRHVRARYTFPNDLIVDAEGGWMDDPSFAFTMTAKIVCADATLDFDLMRQPELRLIHAGTGHAGTGHAGTGHAETGTVEELTAGVDYPAGNGYDHEIAACIAAVKKGEAAPVTLRDAAATQRLLDREIALVR